MSSSDGTRSFLKFVDRDEQLEFIEKKITPGKRGEPITLPIVCIWGARGIGKSYFLGELARRYCTGREKSKGKHSAIAAFLDFNPVESEDLWSTEGPVMVRVIQSLWQQLTRQSSDIQPVPAIDDAKQLAALFSEQLRALTTNHTPILIFDTIEELYREKESFAFFEESILQPAAKTDRVLIVVASRDAIRRWDKFQVRRRVTLYPLGGLDAKGIEEQLNCTSGTAKWLQQYTGGHPLASYRLAEQLSAVFGGAGSDLWPTVSEKRLADTFDSIADELLSSLAPPQRRLAKTASALPWINIGPLRAIAEALRIEAPNQTDDYYDHLIDAYQQAALVHWSFESSNYLMDPSVRSTLRSALRLADEDDWRIASECALKFQGTPAEAGVNSV